MLPYLSKYKKSGYDNKHQHANQRINSYVSPIVNSNYRYFSPQCQLDTFQQDLNQFARRKAQEKKVQFALAKANASKLKNRLRQQNLREQIANLKQRLQNRQRQQLIQQRILNRMENLIFPLIQQSRLPQKSHYQRPSKRQSRYSRQKKHRSLHNNATSNLLPRYPTQKLYNNSKKQIRKKLLSKFRVAAYVVYFAIYFPKYAVNFTQVRLKHIKVKYFSKSFHMVINQRLNFQLISKALELPQLKLILTNKLMKNHLSGKNIGPNDSISNRIINQPQLRSMKSEFKMQNDVLDLDIVKYIIQFLFDKINQQVKVGTFSPFYDFFAETCMNNSFFMDHVLIRSQLLPIRFHPFKGYTIFDKKIQEIILIQVFLNKIVVFHMLIYYQISFLNSKILIKQNESAKYKMLQEIQLHIGVSILIMVLIVNKAVEKNLKITQKGNYYDLPITLRPKLLHQILKLIQKNEFIEKKTKQQLLQLIFGYETGLKQVQESIGEFYLFIRDKMDIIINEMLSVLIPQCKKYKKEQYNKYKQQVLKKNKLQPYDGNIFHIRSLGNVTEKQIQKTNKFIQEVQNSKQKSSKSATSIQNYLDQNRKALKHKFVNLDKNYQKSQAKLSLPVVLENLENDKQSSIKIMSKNPILEQSVVINDEQNQQKSPKDYEQQDQQIQQISQNEYNDKNKNKRKKTKTKPPNEPTSERNNEPQQQIVETQPQPTKTKKKKEKNKQNKQPEDPKQQAKEQLKKKKKKKEPKEQSKEQQDKEKKKKRKKQKEKQNLQQEDKKEKKKKKKEKH